MQYCKKNILISFINNNTIKTISSTPDFFNKKKRSVTILKHSCAFFAHLVFYYFNAAQSLDGGIGINELHVRLL